MEKVPLHVVCVCACVCVRERGRERPRHSRFSLPVYLFYLAMLGEEMWHVGGLGFLEQLLVP